jgi:hypothetical protein
MADVDEQSEEEKLWIICFYLHKYFFIFSVVYYLYF